MWIVALALRRPITIVVMASLMMLLGLIAFFVEFYAGATALPDRR